MKDYYDLWIIGPGLRDGSIASRAGDISNLARRGTPIPDGVPDGLSPAFAEDALKRQQWESFKQDLSVDPGSLDGVVSALEAFLMPRCAAAAKWAQEMVTKEEDKLIWARSVRSVTEHDL